MGITTVSSQVRNFGAKVKKEMGGYYIYVGRNFTVKFNSDQCVSKWWEVNLYDNCSDVVYKEFEYYNKFDTKSELVYQLLQLDKSI